MTLDRLRQVIQECELNREDLGIPSNMVDMFNTICAIIVFLLQSLLTHTSTISGVKQPTKDCQAIANSAVLC